MASALKRKRGQAELAEVPESQPAFPQVSGWDAAFKPPGKQTKELVQTNGTKGSGMYSHYITSELGNLGIQFILHFTFFWLCIPLLRGMLTI